MREREKSDKWYRVTGKYNIRKIHRDFDRDRDDIGLKANTIEEKRYREFDTERDVSISF